MCDSVKEKFLLKEIEVYKAKIKALEVELEYKDSYIETMEKNYRDELLKLHCKLSDYEGTTDLIEDYLSREIVTDSWKLETMCKKLRQNCVLDFSKVKDPKRTIHILSSEWGRYRKLHGLHRLTIENNIVKMK